jgi:hypothetical protein
VAVLIDLGNRRARIETTSQIGWFNLASVWSDTNQPRVSPNSEAAVGSCTV